MIGLSGEILKQVKAIDTSVNNIVSGGPRFTSLSSDTTTSFPIHSTNTGINIAIPGQVYTGDGSQDGSIDANIAESADIDAPDNWTNFINLSGGPFIVEEFTQYNSASVVRTLTLGHIIVNAAETVGDALLLEVIIDGGTMSSKMVSDGATSGGIFITIPTLGILFHSGSNITGLVGQIICKDSFILRATRKGSFSSVSSGIGFGCYNNNSASGRGSFKRFDVEYF